MDNINVQPPDSDVANANTVHATAPIQLDSQQKNKIAENYERAKRIRLSRIKDSPSDSSLPCDPRDHKTIAQQQGSEVRRGGFFSSSQSSPKKVEIRGTFKSRNDPLIVHPLEQNRRCSHCPSIELDPHLSESFGVLVCSSCREANPELYSLIVKTSAKQDFLLTDEELQDSAIFPSIRKPNPHKSTWTDMQLFLSMHVRQFAIEKWGSLAMLQEEINRRSHDKEMRKEKKYNQILSGTATSLLLY